ncbi:MAG TPA: hypothetical protein DC000_12405 [Clostridiales bacterium]|nr:hypothetical protein [Clostridiales bacterium]
MIIMIIYALLIINLLLVIIYLQANLNNKQKLLIGLFFVFLPIIGFAIYLVALLVIRIISSKLYDRLSLVHRYKFDDEVLTPDINKELNIIPISDAMVISNNVEKRKLLLEQLKKDIYNNYKNILIASNDSDSETAHYVASAKMEIYNKLNINLQSVMESYEKESSKLSNVYDVLIALIDIIDSKLLSVNESNIYKTKYCNIIENEFMSDDIEIDEEKVSYFDKFIEYLVHLEDYDFVIPAFSKIPEEYKNENMYIQILKMYYSKNQKDNFKMTLDILCNSSLALSNEGVGIIRFWLSERN